MYWIWANLQRFQALNDKCKICNIFSLPYKEIHWQKFSCVVLVPYMCTLEQLKKDHLTIITAFLVYKFFTYGHYHNITNKWQNKPTYIKKTFIETSNVVDKPSKFINWHMFMHYCSYINMYVYIC